MKIENLDFKQGNRILKYILGAIAIVFIALWLKGCLNRGSNSETVIDTKEVKGSFLTVQAKDIEAKELPSVSTETKHRTSFSSSELESFKEKYGLTQKKLDSLLVVNKILDSIANASNDKRYQELYSNCKFIEFKHEFDNDTIHITLTGLSRGVPQNLNLHYLIKSRKDTIQLKQMWCRVFLGSEVGVNKELNQGTYKFNLMIQNAKNDLISASYQRILNDNFYLVGYNKALFTINKRQKKK